MVLTLIGLALRVVGALRPLDQPLWREGDLLAIARGFARETMNPLSPRVAWRGRSTGEAEGEFPLVSWTTGMLWRAVGEHDRLIRVLPLLAGLLTVLVFARFAIRIAGPRAGWCATAVLALNPLTVFTSSNTQSDSLMLLGVVIAVSSSWSWLAPDLSGENGHASGETGQQPTKLRWVYPVATAAGLVLAGLMKLPALHVGAVIVAVVIIHRGVKGLMRPQVLAVGLLGAGIPLAWAAYAHQTYARTGLSLGVSNEQHFIGKDFISEPGLLVAIAKQEMRYVFMLLGLVLVLVAFARGWKPKATQLATSWFAAAGLMLVIAGRTTGDAWAFYYHVAAVPPIALLVGIGAYSVPLLDAPKHVRRSRFVAGVLSVIAVLVMAISARSAWLFARPQTPSDLFVCANTFRPFIGANDLILASGGTKFDSGGHHVAYDASYMFAWTDRFGWTIPIEDQSVSSVEGYAKQGAKWFIAEHDALAEANQSDQRAITQKFRRVASCSSADLLKLTS